MLLYAFDDKNFGQVVNGVMPIKTRESKQTGFDSRNKPVDGFKRSRRAGLSCKCNIIPRLPYNLGCRLNPLYQPCIEIAASGQ